MTAKIPSIQHEDVRERIAAVIPPRSLVVGVPARVVREVTQEEYDHLLEHAAGYVEAVRRYLPR